MPLRSGPAHQHGMHWTQFVSGVPFTLDGPEFRCAFDPATYGPTEPPAAETFAGAGPFWARHDGLTITFDVPRSTASGPGVHVTAWGAHAPGTRGRRNRTGCSARSTTASARIPRSTTTTSAAGTIPSASND